ncbi:hypothetical protein I6N90_13855 [Paenibacillus sp. GSMTC-2017]|uniref:hypothetical protein n=1 Tax=Paenibacillus sp. GSMTC-2017 TaxID=2794350 RepID=UPI0018D7A61B|nr:hypothetical protein [Paenibacillus sp. GSMTC-2017]MBH5318884.1 hypothetical protein [Paenibacillus sp. GSMTC-2017]
MYEITIDLVNDWINTVKEVLRGSGYTLEDGLTNEEIALRYFLHSQPEEQALELATDTMNRLREMQEIVISHIESTIVPDIRSRTKYEGNVFQFNWVYDQGEHIVELNSEYRIPL